MRAVLVERFGRREVHWRADDEWTTCGLRLATIDVAEHVDLEKLPHDGACLVCDELAARPIARRVAPSDVTAEPQPGIVRKVGPLYHGTGFRRGHRLA